MHPTDLTVAAVVEHEGHFLLVEEHAMGRRVLSQPGGHIESGESPEEAVIREALEETGCDIACGDLIGVYLWIQPQTRQQFLRITYAARFLQCDEQRKLDEGVIARRWLSLAELEQRSGESPLQALHPFRRAGLLCHRCCQCQAGPSCYGPST